MTVRIRSWGGALPRAVWLAVITALIPLPLAASDTAASAKAPVIKVSMEQIVAREVAASPATKPVMVRAARQGQGPGSDPGFFRSRPGIVALVVMVAGTGYALYSAKQDRIHSAGKK